MLDFDLVRPSSLDEAVRLLDTDDAGVRAFSGGTALMLMMKSGVFEPTTLVDLTALGNEHRAISETPEGGLRIGALASLTDLEHSGAVARIAPVVPQACKRLSNVRVRNQARVGGCLAHGDPHMDLPPILAALRAEVVATGPAGERRIPVEDLFAGYYETVLTQGELISALLVPPQTGWRTVYRKTTVRTHDDWPTLSVAVSLLADGAAVSEARVILSAATEKLTRMPAVEAAVTAAPLDAQRCSEAGREAANAAETTDDAQGSAAYKKELIAVEVRRALAEAIEQGQAQ
jgi:carbon-monoxide dehydrogenase medium subunit